MNLFSHKQIENIIRSIINEYQLYETIDDIGKSIESIESFSDFIVSEPDILNRFGLPNNVNAIVDILSDFYNNEEELDFDISEVSDQTPKDSLEFQDYLNFGVDEENHWTGIYNNAVLLEKGFKEYDVEEFVKEINIPEELKNDERTQDFKNYLLSAILSIDMKMDYRNLSVSLEVDPESLKKYENEGEFKGLYIPIENKIVVNNRSRNTINHEIGHYIDRYLSSPYDGDGYLSMSFNITSLNKDLRNKTSHNLLLWADKFHRFIYQLKQKAQIRQFGNNEVFARFIEFFINWTQGLSNITYYKEHDKFSNENCIDFIRLLQERSYLLSQKNAFSNYSLVQQSANIVNIPHEIQNMTNDEIYHWFKDNAWSSAYGGNLWANITQALIKLLEAKDMGSKMIWIDHIIDLQHNTGSVFTKDNDLQKITNKIIQFKTSNTSIKEFVAKSYNKLSPEVRNLVKQFIRFNKFEKTSQTINFVSSDQNHLFYDFYALSIMQSLVNQYGSPEDKNYYESVFNQVLESIKDIFVKYLTYATRREARHVNKMIRQKDSDATAALNKLKQEKNLEDFLNTNIGKFYFEKVKTNPKTCLLYAVDIIKGPWPEAEQIIATDAYSSYRYALNVLKGRFPEGESSIATDAEYAYEYARYVIKGPFEKGEPVIAKDMNLAKNYAEYILHGRFLKGEPIILSDVNATLYYIRKVVKGPWPEAEPYLAKHPNMTYIYARDVLKGRFPEGESTIANNAEYAYEYARYVIKGRFPEGESAIAKDTYSSYYYARYVIKGRFLEGESAIATDAYSSYYYASNVLKGRFPEGEKTIANNEYYAYEYARDIIRGRFPEGESTIATDSFYAVKYARDVIKGRFPEGEQSILNSQYKDDYLQLIGKNDEESLDNNYEDKISNSLSELYLLVEAELKIKQLLKQFPQFSQEQIEQFAQFDPTPGKSYITWILRMVKNNKLRLPEDGNNIFQALLSFTKFKNDPRIKNNINDYKSPGDLYQTLEYFDFFESKTQKRKQYDEAKSNEGSQLLVDQDGIKIVKVQNVQTAMKYAQGTQWCIEDEEHAKHYLRQGPLYFIYKNNQPYALLHVESNQLKDVYDDELEEEDRLALKPYFVENKIMHPKIYDFAIMNNYDPNNYTEQDALMLFSQDAGLAFNYAFYVLKRRFPEGEPAIAKDAKYAYEYALNVIDGRFPEGEKTIANDEYYAYRYARDVIGGRFPEGEKTIANDAEYAYYYALYVIDGRFPEGESTIATDADSSYYYARDILKGRFPEAEDIIAKNDVYAYSYARDIIKGRFPEGEKTIAKDAEYAYIYALNVIKGRFPEAEQIILNSYYKDDYLQLIGKNNEESLDNNYEDKISKTILELFKS